MKFFFKNADFFFDCSHFFRLLSPFCGTSCFYLEFSFVAVVHHDKKNFFCHSGSLLHNNFPLLHWFTVTNKIPLPQWHIVTLEFSFVAGIQRDEGFFLHCTGPLWHMNFPSSQWITATKELSFVIVVHCDNFPLLKEEKKKKIHNIGVVQQKGDKNPISLSLSLSLLSPWFTATTLKISLSPWVTATTLKNSLSLC